MPGIARFAKKKPAAEAAATTTTNTSSAQQQQQQQQQNAAPTLEPKTPQQTKQVTFDAGTKGAAALSVFETSFVGFDDQSPRGGSDVDTSFDGVFGMDGIRMGVMDNNIDAPQDEAGIKFAVDSNDNGGANDTTMPPPPPPPSTGNTGGGGGGGGGGISIFRGRKSSAGSSTSSTTASNMTTIPEESTLVATDDSTALSSFDPNQAAANNADASSNAPTGPPQPPFADATTVPHTQQQQQQQQQQTAAPPQGHAVVQDQQQQLQLSPMNRQGTQATGNDSTAATSSPHPFAKNHHHHHHHHQQQQQQPADEMSLRPSKTAASSSSSNTMNRGASLAPQQPLMTAPPARPNLQKQQQQQHQQQQQQAINGVPAGIQNKSSTVANTHQQPSNGMSRGTQGNNTNTRQPPNAASARQQGMNGSAPPHTQQDSNNNKSARSRPNDLHGTQNSVVVNTKTNIPVPPGPNGLLSTQYSSSSTRQSTNAPVRPGPKDPTAKQLASDRTGTNGLAPPRTQQDSVMDNVLKPTMNASTRQGPISSQGSNANSTNTDGQQQKPASSVPPRTGPNTTGFSLSQSSGSTKSNSVQGQQQPTNTSRRKEPAKALPIVPNTANTNTNTSSEKSMQGQQYPTNTSVTPDTRGVPIQGSNGMSENAMAVGNRVAGNTVTPGLAAGGNDASTLDACGTFDELKDALFNELRDFEDCYETYQEGMLNDHVALGTAHAEMLIMQAQEFDLCQKLDETLAKADEIVRLEGISMNVE